MVGKIAGSACSPYPVLAILEPRARLFILIIIIALSLSGCQDGDTSGGAPSGDPLGGYNIRIEDPTTASTYTIDRPSLTLRGYAFTHDGVVVSWVNHTTGESGIALSYPIYICYYDYCWITQNVWGANVQLAMGENLFEVKGVDPDGHHGEASITITRVSDTTAPTVTGHSPDQTDVTSPAIVINYSEQMSLTSQNDTSLLLKDAVGTPVPITVTPGNFSTTITPNNALSLDKKYTVTVTTGVEDFYGGNALESPYTWSFWVGNGPPVVKSVYPGPGTSCVASADTKILVEFNESVEPLSAANGIRILAPDSSNVDGTVTATTGQTPAYAYFQPNGDLVPAGTYSGYVGSPLTDLAGNLIETDFSWNFNTASPVGSWQTLSTINQPPPAYQHTAVWTGSEMLVWGDGTAHRYNPSTDTWNLIPASSDAGSRYNHTAVWTGQEMIVWGGWLVELNSKNRTSTGASFNPVDQTWRPVSTAYSPDSSEGHVAVWTGTEMIVWGGLNPSGGYSVRGGKYDPATDSWTLLSMTGQPTGRINAKVVWTGTEMIVWGGRTSDGLLGRQDGARYNPVTDTWAPMEGTGSPVSVNSDFITAIWTGSEMLLLSSSNSAAYDPVSNSWRELPSMCSPGSMLGDAAVWTGSDVILWGWSANPDYSFGAAYNPVTNSWKPIPHRGAPSWRRYHSAVWTGSEMIVWGGRTVFETVASGARYRP